MIARLSPSSLLLARFTPLRYVFLTAPPMLFMATLLTMVLATGRPARPWS